MELVANTSSGASTLIIGGGPAGLSAAYELVRHGQRPIVLEADRVVGGLSRTVEHKGYCFDIGGHRFFTKVSAVERMWRDVLGDDLLDRPRLSRIYYRSKYFQYPIEPVNALANLGVLPAISCGLSYAKARIFPRRETGNLEDWLINQFGGRLYETFFKTYTEKVWGIPCSEIRAEWAAQRIRGLSLSAVLKNAMTRGNGSEPKSLIREFLYPRKGPGMMWERTRDLIQERGARVVMKSAVEKILWRPGAVLGVQAGDSIHRANSFISSMPIRDLVERLQPAAPAWLERAAAKLKYRDFLTVALVVRGRNLFPDNWIYVHEPGVKVGRIQNFGNWSPEMVPNAANSCLGLEYFCFEGDGLWAMRDADLIRLATHELTKLGLARAESVVDGCVVRAPKAYPVYDEHYQDVLRDVRRFLEMTPNLQLIGRNGMHRYNNQDHSMLTGFLAARNVLRLGHYDLWKVNADTDYHEDNFHLSEREVEAMYASQPAVPARARSAHA